MSSKAFDCTSPSSRLAQLPLKIDQRRSAGSTISRLLLLSPALVAGVLACSALAMAAADHPSLAALVVERPLASAQILAAIALWGALFVAPASMMIARLCKGREATITAVRVEITDRSPLGVRTHSVPLQDYLGIAHHIRASLSGLTHELVLVHREPAFDINLLSGERVTQAELESAKALLGLPEVSARTIYARESSPPLQPGAQLTAAAPVSA